MWYETNLEKIELLGRPPCSSHSGWSLSKYCKNIKPHSLFVQEDFLKGIWYTSVCTAHIQKKTNTFFCHPFNCATTPVPQLSLRWNISSLSPLQKTSSLFISAFLPLQIVFPVVFKKIVAQLQFANSLFKRYFPRWNWIRVGYSKDLSKVKDQRQISIPHLYSIQRDTT